MMRRTLYSMAMLMQTRCAHAGSVPAAFASSKAAITTTTAGSSSVGGSSSSSATCWQRLRGGTSSSSSSFSTATAEGFPQLTLEAADAMANAALAEASKQQFNPISVFVMDVNGRVLVSKTMPGTPRLIPSIAEGKAGAAIGTHSSSRALKEKYVPERAPQLLAMTATSLAAQSQPFCAVPGGVLCRDEVNRVVGAIGVSGASADEDEHCAVIGAKAVGLVTDPAESPL
jgi:glc operon protein GlcG